MSSIASENPTDRAVPSLKAAALLAFWLLWVVDSALPQLQMALLGGSVPVRGALLDGAFLLMMAVLLLVRGRLPAPPPAVATTIVAFMAYLFLELFFLVARKQVTGVGLITDYYRYYFFLLALPFVFVAEGSLSADRVFRWLLIAFVPLAWLGLQQHFGGDPVVPTRAVDGRFQIFAWDWRGEVRAFSLFNSGWSFGHFCILVGAMAFFRLRQTDALPTAMRRLCWLVLAVAPVCAYASQTRTVFLVAFCTIVAAATLDGLRTGRRNRLALLLPVAFGAGAYLVAYSAKPLVALLGMQDETLFATGSLDARWDAWTTFGSYWLGGSVSEFLFGLGIGQHDSGTLYSESTVLIDNMIVAIGVQVGAVGVMLWIIMMWQIWCWVLARATQQDTALHWGIAAVWSTWTLSLTFSAATVFYGVLAIGAVLMTGSGQVTARRDDAAVDEGAVDSVGNQPLTGGARMRIIGHE
ncbi:MAG: hypothetical protein ACPHN2_03010 [Sinimarinibacterium flocculans]|uniref:hypothetical protein n=1 Tax=Sinimarinibacterium flocculans TaxID=985250 RepID=UPI003C59936A